MHAVPFVSDDDSLDAGEVKAIQGLFDRRDAGELSHLCKRTVYDDRRLVPLRGAKDLYEEQFPVAEVVGAFRGEMAEVEALEERRSRGACLFGGDAFVVLADEGDVLEDREV